MNNTKLILGVGGQDGQSLAEYLLSKNEEVVGLVRRSSQPRRYLQPLIDKGLKIVEGDITDSTSMINLFKKYQPEHIYALAAMSHVGSSFEQPMYTFDVVAKGILNILEAIRIASPDSKMYNAASSEMFGSNYSMIEYFEGICPHQVNFNYKEQSKEKFDYFMNPEEHYGDYEGLPFQNEITPMCGNSPYGVSKLAAFNMTRLYRESYGLFASSGILFNHDGIYRSITFATRKITHYVSRLRLAKEKSKNIEKLKLGNIDTFRDITSSSDMVRGMNMILNHNKPDDFVLGSGKAYSIREFTKRAFNLIGEDYLNHIEIDPSLFRPCEVEYLCSDPSKAKKVLGWEPLVSFDELIRQMVENDIKRTNQKYQSYGDI